MRGSLGQSKPFDLSQEGGAPSLQQLAGVRLRLKDQSDPAAVRAGIAHVPHQAAPPLAQRAAEGLRERLERGLGHLADAAAPLALRPPRRLALRAVDVVVAALPLAAGAHNDPVEGGHLPRAAALGAFGVDLLVALA